MPFPRRVPIVVVSAARKTKKKMRRSFVADRLEEGEEDDGSIALLVDAAGATSATAAVASSESRANVHDEEKPCDLRRQRRQRRRSSPSHPECRTLPWCEDQDMMVLTAPGFDESDDDDDDNGEEDDDNAFVTSYEATESHDRIDHRHHNDNHRHHHRDCFDQWDALLERERREAYSLPMPSASASAVTAVTAANDAAAESDEGREKICLWAYEIVDHYDLDRRLVSIALSYLDRLLSNGLVEKDAPGNNNNERLAGMTCLYLAIKIHSSAEKGVFDAAHMASFSSGYFSEEHVVDMEEHICRVFDWYLNPPVADTYVDILAPLLKTELSNAASSFSSCDPNCYCHRKHEHPRSEVPKRARHELIRQSKYLCELAVIDPFFSARKASSIARAAVLVAMDLLRFPAVAIEWFANFASSSSSSSSSSGQRDCRNNRENDDDDAEEEAYDACVRRLRWICGEGDFPRPDVTFDDCAVRRASSEEGEDVRRTRRRRRSVTPMKGEVPSDLKRAREEAIAELSSRSTKEAPEKSCQKRRRIRSR